MNVFHVCAIGAPVVLGIYLRYKTWKTTEQFNTSKYTVAVFLSLGFGLIIIAPQKAAGIIIDISQTFIGEANFAFLWFLCGFSLRMMFIYFRSDGYEMNLNESIKSSLFGVAFVFIAVIAMSAGVPWRNANSIFSLSSFMLLVGISSLGFVHSLIGPIVAGMNTAALIKYLILGGDFSDFWNITSLLELFEIDGRFLKIGIFALSTGLGLSDCYNDYIKRYI